MFTRKDARRSCNDDQSLSRSHQNCSSAWSKESFNDRRFLQEIQEIGGAPHCKWIRILLMFSIRSTHVNKVSLELHRKQLYFLATPSLTVTFYVQKFLQMHRKACDLRISSSFTLTQVLTLRKQLKSHKITLRIYVWEKKKLGKQQSLQVCKEYGNTGGICFCRLSIFAAIRTHVHVDPSAF